MRDSLLRKARTSQCHIDWDFYKETQTLLADNQVMQNNHNSHAFVKLFGGTHKIDWRN